MASADRRHIVDAEVLGYELRGNPLKHHVYQVRVTWSTGLVIIVYRRYSQFFDFQCRLLDAYPKEAGLSDYHDRIIPFIPGKVLFGQSLKRKTVEYRRHAFNTYCQRLVRLPAHISQCRLVLDFFDARESDVKHLTAGSSGSSGSRSSGLQKTSAVDGGRGSSARPREISAPVQVEQYSAVADYVPQSSGECPLTAGLRVEVIDKKDTGWWFVQTDDAEQGWVPATYLEQLYESIEDGDGDVGGSSRSSTPPVDAHLPPTTSYVCCTDYTANSTDELSLHRGVLVEVIEKHMNGWWKIRCSGMVGLGPAVSLVKANSCKAKAVLEALAAPGSRPPTEIAVRRGPPPRRSQERRPVAPAASATSDTAIAPRCGEPALLHIASDARAIPLRPKPPQARTTKMYEAIDNYVAGSTTDDSLSLCRGQVVEVIEKNASGWWYVRGEGCMGWAPSTYLRDATASIVLAAATPSPIDLSPNTVTAATTGNASGDGCDDVTSPAAREAVRQQPNPLRRQKQQDAPSPVPRPLPRDAARSDVAETKDSSSCPSQTPTRATQASTATALVEATTMVRPCRPLPPPKPCSVPTSAAASGSSMIEATARRTPPPPPPLPPAASLDVHRRKAALTSSSSSNRSSPDKPPQPSARVLQRDAGGKREAPAESSAARSSGESRADCDRQSTEAASAKAGAPTGSRLNVSALVQLLESSGRTTT